MRLVTRFTSANRSDGTVIGSENTGYQMIFTLEGPIGTPGSGQFGFSVSGGTVIVGSGGIAFLRSSNDITYGITVDGGTFTPP